MLDESVDAACRNDVLGLRPRIAATLVTAGLMFVSLGWRPALAWCAVMVLQEAWRAWAVRPAVRGGLTRRQRLSFVASAAAMTLAWVSVPILYWARGEPDFRTVAIIVLAGQLIHAQAFTFRSRAVLWASAGIPGAAIAGLVLFSGALHGAALLTAGVGSLILLYYAAASATSNRIAAARRGDALSQAEQAVDARSRFLAMVSHELRTPLNGVIGMVHALGRTRLDPEQQRYLATLQSSGDDLMVLLNDVLDLSKMEAGRLDLDPQPHPVGEIAHAVVELWRETAEAKGLCLALEDGVGPLWVMVDGLRLKQILTNLVSNAVKFTASGAVILRLDLIRAQAGRADIQFSIRDTGIGMTAEQISRLFAAYAQAEASTSAQFGGTGLGLSICRSLAGLMGGEVAVQSAPGEGSTFTLRLALPIADAPAAAAQPQTHIAAEGLRVLVVDDNATNRLVVQTLLSAAGLQVWTEASAEAALDRLRAQPFDVLLTDVHMAGLSGLELLTRVRNGEGGRRDLPIVALTGDPDIPKGVFDAVQTKPIDPQSLLLTLATLGAGRDAPGAGEDRQAAVLGPA